MKKFWCSLKLNETRQSYVEIELTSSRSNKVGVQRVCLMNCVLSYFSMEIHRI